MNNTKPRIDAELQTWIDPLTSDELAGLKASLLPDGCRDPLVVWSGWLPDGHNRNALCHQHGIAFQTVEKTGLVTKADARIWMIQNQRGKRNTSDFGRVALALRLKPQIEQRAQERMLAGKAAPAGEVPTDPVLNSAQGTGKSREELTKIADVGHDTVRKVERIIANATPEVVAKVRSGELSINAAGKKVTPPKPAKLVNASTMAELTESGGLVPMLVMSCTKVNMKGAATAGGEWTDQATAVRGMEIIGNVLLEWLTLLEPQDDRVRRHHRPLRGDAPNQTAADLQR